MGNLERREMPVENGYDRSWDLVKSKKGNLPKNEDAWDKKYQEWVERDWIIWLKENLTFPFMAKRKDDEDDAYFTDIAKREPFRLGHTMRVIGLEGQEPRNGIIVKVSEKRRIGHVSLFDLEVTPKDDPNFFPVREYVVWDANK